MAERCWPHHQWPSVVAALTLVASGAIATVTAPTAAATVAPPAVHVIPVDSSVQDVGGVAVGASALWVTGQNTDTIARVTAAGPVFRELDGVEGPAGVVVTTDGGVWIAGEDNDTIARLDANTGTLVVFDSGGVDGPRSIVKGPDGNLWVTGAGNDTVGRVNPNTGAVTSFPATGLDEPDDLAVGPDAMLWVTGAANGKLGRVDPATGAMSVVAVPALVEPRGIAASPDGRLWVADHGNGLVEVIDAVTLAHSSVLTSTVGMNQPFDIAASAGRMWVADPSVGGAVDIDTSTLTPTSHPSGHLQHLVVAPDGSIQAAGAEEYWDPTAVATHVALSAAGAVTTTTRLAMFSSGVADLTVAPDGRAWVIEASRTARLASVSTNGTASPSPFSAGTGDLLQRGQGIAAAPNGTLWTVVTKTLPDEGTSAVAQIDTTLGKIIELPTSDWRCCPAIGPGGLVWYTSGTTVYRGSSAVAAVAGANLVALGPDGNMWVTRTGGGLARVDPASGAVTLFATPGITNIGGITAGPDANLWITAPSIDTVARVDPTTGTLTSFATTGIDQPRGIAAATDGGLWVTGQGNDTIGRVEPATGATGAFPAHGVSPFAIEAGPGNSVWIAGAGDVALVELANLATAVQGTITDAASGQPVGGAWALAINADTGAFAQGAVADATGTYRAEVPTGNYWVEFLDPTGAHTGEAYDNRPLGDLSQATATHPATGSFATATAGLDPATGSIAGTVTDDATAVPVDRAWVFVVDATTGAVAGADQADTAGAYRVDGLAPGPYKVLVVDPSAAHHHEYHHDAADFDAATAVDVTAAHTTAIDAALAAQTPPGTPTAVSELTAGDFHTCARSDAGAVHCWGDGDRGRLGYANTTDIGDTETPGSVGPVNLGPGRTALSIAAGGQHTCAVLDDHTVRCWGNGAYGKLGYANTTDIGDDETPGSVGPVDLGPGRTALSIAAGYNHTCAVLDDHTVRCWGEGLYGQLGYANQTDIGNNETPGSVGPVDLGPGRTVLSIAAGHDHTCAVLDDHTVRCWGDGYNGRLGYGNIAWVGDNETPGSVGPVDLGPGRTALSIVAGNEYTCALLDDHTVRCWGSAFYGKLGYPNTFDIGDDETPGSVGPVDLGPGRTALSIDAGDSHICAVLDDHTVRCWGYGNRGRLGYANTTDIGDNETPGSVGPVDLGPGRTALSIAAGYNHTCAVLDDHTARCWGRGADGKLGYANTTDIGDDETPGSVGPVDLGPADASIIRGAVTAGADGSPVPGTFVMAINAVNGAFTAGEAADSSGQYQMAVPPGSYWVQFVDPAASLRGEVYDNHPLGDFPHATAVSPTPTTPAVADAALDVTTGTIAGTVTDATSTLPLAHAWVAAINANTGRVAATDAADAAGRYRITRLPPATYKLIFIDPTAAHRYEYHDNADDFYAAIPIAVTATATVNVDAALQPLP